MKLYQQNFFDTDCRFDICLTFAPVHHWQFFTVNWKVLKRSLNVNMFLGRLSLSLLVLPCYGWVPPLEWYSASV